MSNEYWPGSVGSTESVTYDLYTIALLSEELYADYKYMVHKLIKGVSLS